MLTLTLSAHSLEKALCARRLWYYKVVSRRPITPRDGADAGTCLHVTFAALNRREPPAAQELALLTERAKLPPSRPDDYRTGAYLTEALAVLRADWLAHTEGWEVLEVERRDFTRLGVLDWVEARVHPAWRSRLPDKGVEAGDAVAIDLEYVRDLVIRRDGEVWVVDLKSTSRDNGAEAAAWHVMDQFKGYTWALRAEHPDWNVKGVQPVRLILRKPLVKPAKGPRKPTWEVQWPTPVRFDAPAGEESPLLAEWRDGVLKRAADILRRDPDDAADWPLMAGTGTCHGPYGCCDYLDVCRLPPGDRLLKLAGPGFEASDAGKVKARRASGEKPEVAA